jgi:hypothetical protein
MGSVANLNARRRSVGFAGDGLNHAHAAKTCAVLLLAENPAFEFDRGIVVVALMFAKVRHAGRPFFAMLCALAKQGIARVNIAAEANKISSLFNGLLRRVVLPQPQIGSSSRFNQIVPAQSGNMLS